METVTFSLTITTELNEWLKKQARNLGIPKNAQIIFFLTQEMRDQQILEKMVKPTK